MFKTNADDDDANVFFSLFLFFCLLFILLMCKVNQEIFIMKNHSTKSVSASLIYV